MQTARTATESHNAELTKKSNLHVNFSTGPKSFARRYVQIWFKAIILRFPLRRRCTDC